MERLDPENIHPYFYNTFDKAEDSEKTNEPLKNVQQWLDVASGIDQVARIWLDYVFKQAALCATDEKILEWLKKSIALRDIDDISIVVNFLPESALNKGETASGDAQRKKRELINSRIKRLEAFSDLNQALLSIFNKELERI